MFAHIFVKATNISFNVGGVDFGHSVPVALAAVISLRLDADGEHVADVYGEGMVRKPEPLKQAED